jgi:hypothetical protein
MYTRSIAVVLVACFAGYLALPQQDAAARSPNNLSWLFAADAETLLATPLSQAFSCEGREYGYYGDVANRCQVFHICLPLLDHLGVTFETAHWSFICGNGTVFDQEKLVCNHELDAFPCDQSESLYNTVEFGKIPEPNTKVAAAN